LKTAREPIFNLPPVVTAILAVLVLILAVRAYLLSPEDDFTLLKWFAFIPARYDVGLLHQGAYPGGLGSDVWTFVSYGLLHDGWLHLGLNAVWLVAFGTPVARRFGVPHFLAFLAATTVAGAALHLATHLGDQAPMIGASAAISGCMAAALRFVFQRQGPLSTFAGFADGPAYRVPAAALGESLRDRRVLAFLALWFGLNFLFGASSLTIVPDGQSIAWQAHVGGFVVGLLGFSLFDPIGRQPPGRIGDQGSSASESNST
jgi:membrane associated rhomboid family serine protease